ncbi:MAG: hypothetical protein IPM82_19605 [Saprospiraceae bacterium]|nr:hypothetical protein [Saprospiraceae bacterium]
MEEDGADGFFQELTLVEGGGDEGDSWEMRSSSGVAYSSSVQGKPVFSRDGGGKLFEEEADITEQSTSEFYQSLTGSKRLNGWLFLKYQ